MQHPRVQLYILYSPAIETIPLPDKYGFMKSLKNEIVKLAPRGRVNCVAPGWTGTAMAEESVRRGEHWKALQTTPLRFGGINGFCLRT
jgi:hypothetical protein